MLAVADMFDVDSSSQSCSHSTGAQASCSDDEVMLASDNLKKRAGRKKFKETRHPVYKGVRRRGSEKWVCEVRVPNKKSRIWLGTFPTAEMAARAHDVAALALRGRRAACLNFADSAWRLPIPTSADSRDIQKAAAEAAERFRPVGGDDAGAREDKLVEDECRKAAGEYYNDEEDIFGMPGLLTNMAEAKAGEFYIDEEDIFGMPGLLTNMAEAMLLPPPHYNDADDVDADFDSYVRLWSFPM
ncbi:hypothetical protein MLD38_030359 [Melastoma candidum]|uniref:Uncharacterized protein n=1 Tax=Melastoma candidum TaxID=119954 RepID=A0ACB9MMZ2_9MYRT|nr:hypothetical protein MLD38_030359 [Melastoma candidum]